MIGVCAKPEPSSASRIAPTRPSIMSEGATMSTPASASETEVRASSSIAPSLSTSPRALSGPQCPCSVYSQRQTSAITASAGSASLSALTAACVIPSCAQAPLPSASFCEGTPNSSTARTPSSRSSAASAASRSVESRACPGIDSIGSRTPAPSVTNNG